MRNSNTETISQNNSLILVLENPNLQSNIIDIIEERNRNRNSNIPIITSFEDDLEIMDNDLIRSINEDESLNETRISIMENLSQNIHDEDLVRLLVRMATPNIQDILTEISSSHIQDFSRFSPVINIVVLRSIGLDDINILFQEINRAMIEVTNEVPIPTIELDNREIIRNRLEEIDQNDNQNVEIDRRTRNDERSNTFRIGWREYIQRGFNLVVGTISVITTARQGINIFNHLIGFFNNSDINQYVQQFSSRPLFRRPITWNDVDSAFWGAWGMLAQYMRDRNNRR